MRLHFAPFLIVAVLGFSDAFASVSADVLRRGADSDWPCIQRKVPELSVAAVWQGPPVDDALARWQEDAEVASLVRDLASRRVPLDEARRAIEEFASGLDSAKRDEALTLLFAGLFQVLDRERGEIIAGIERYARRQVAMAERIRQAQSTVSDLSAQDPQSANRLNEQLIIETRIYNERRQSLSFVCETPIIVEQRLFELARAIQAEMSKPLP